MTQGEDRFLQLLTEIPFPDKGTDEAFARGMIEMVLNATLNRYATALDKAGYIKSRRFAKEGGWIGDKPDRLLQIKFDLMDEAVKIFGPTIVSELKKRVGSVGKQEV